MISTPARLLLSATLAGLVAGLGGVHPAMGTGISMRESPVRVMAGATAIVDVPYTGAEKASTAGTRDLVVPRLALSSQLSAISQLSTESQ